MCVCNKFVSEFSVSVSDSLGCLSFIKLAKRGDNTSKALPEQ